MPKSLTEITGFKELEAQLKRLPDKVKRRELIKIMGQVANPTLRAARAEAPKSKKPHLQKSKNRKYGTYITPGNLQKSLGKITGRRGLGRTNAVVYVGARAGKGKRNDGWYGKFVAHGTVNQRANNFQKRAYERTKGAVTEDAEVKVAKYVQKQIDRLSK